MGYPRRVVDKVIRTLFTVIYMVSHAKSLAVLAIRGCKEVFLLSLVTAYVPIMVADSNAMLISQLHAGRELVFKLVRTS